jgi:prepilin-type N-terminal cleavage/methylation domain-containing protein
MKQFLTNSKGFSLPELLITMAVLGIVLAMAVPNYSKWVIKRQINKESKKLFMEVMLARVSAIKNNNDVIVNFNTASNQYTIHDDSDSDGNVDGGETVKNVALIPQVQFGFHGGSVTDTEGGSSSNSVDLAGGGSILTFNSKGEASDSGSIYMIHISDVDQSNIRLRAVTVIEATGGVEYWEYNEGQTPLWS